ncbi:MAG TPA: tetratricopeptide repeat protein, partial [Pirellulales bacterium]
ANALAGQGKIVEAEAAYREAIRISPSEFHCYVQFGTFLANQGRNVEAEAAFREALRLDPNNKMAQTGLDGVLAKQAEAKSEAPPQSPSDDSKTLPNVKPETQKANPKIPTAEDGAAANDSRSPTTDH